MKRLALLVALAACGGDKPIDWSVPDGAFWPDPRQYPGVGDGRILVTNNFSDQVSVLDYGGVARGELPLLLQIPVGLNPIEREGPHHLTTDPSGEHYYVGISNFVPASGSGPHANHGNGTAPGHVLKLRAADNALVASAQVENNPGDVRMTPDGKTLLVSHFDVLKITQALQDGGDPASNLAIIDPATMGKPRLLHLCPAAHGIGISPDSTHAYVSCFDDHLADVDLVKLTVTLVPVLAAPGTLTDPICEPYAMTVSPSGDSVWVSCFNDGRVLRYDPARGVMDGQVASIGGRAVFGAFAPDGKTLYVPHQAPDGIAVIDVASRAVVGSIDLPASACVNAHVVRFTDDGARMLAVCEGDHSGPGTLLLIDASGPTTRSLVTSVALGIYPDDVQVIR